MPEAQVDSTTGYPVTQLSTNRAAHVLIAGSASTALGGTNVTSSAPEASHVLKSTPGYLNLVIGSTSRSSSQFIHLHNAASLPANGTKPVISIPFAAESPFSIDYGNAGRYFDVGIVVCNSTTQFTLTIGSADCIFDAQIDRGVLP